VNFLGVCQNTQKIYEGNYSHGYPAAANTLLAPVAFVGMDGEVIDEYSSKIQGGLPKWIFREDFFDSITKIRRGRVYKAQDNQPHTWHIQDNGRSDLASESWSSGTAQKTDVVFYQRSGLTQLRNATQYPSVIIGKDPFITIWRIIDIEYSITDTPMLTLKSFRSFGAIPRIIENNIPPDIKMVLLTALEKVENSSNRLGPTDVVDRCRDALSIVFGQQSGNLKVDLGKAIAAFENRNGKREESLVSWSGRIVNRLHPRGKPNEQNAKGLRDISEEDAQLALRCLWLVLVELGWAQNT
jgi:hypothetical protein